ncbi:MAG: hypothetical protein M0Z52_08360 [Actinomycetota bacterium]|nr:hypothetical protein [Actinomycetota bacterium]
MMPVPNVALASYESTVSLSRGTIWKLWARNAFLQGKPAKDKRP